MPICLVRGCRFPNTHTSFAHMCGNCGLIGHGRIECIQDRTVRRVINTLSSDKWCQMYGCRAPETHIDRCHRSFMSHLQSNILLGTDINDVNMIHLLPTDIKFPDNMRYRQNIYMSVDVGMGCCFYVRRQSPQSPIESLFCHSDEWGQYGEHLDQTNKVNAFIFNYHKC